MNSVGIIFRFTILGGNWSPISKQGKYFLQGNKKYIRIKYTYPRFASEWFENTHLHAKKILGKF